MAAVTPIRAYERLTLAEQLVAWLGYRAGDPVEQIARRIGRSPKQARAVLFGGEV